MSELNTLFNKSITAVLWPAFKKQGYKKSGNNFRLYDPSGWGCIVQVQKSLFNSANELRFTINIGFYLPEVEHFQAGHDSGAKFSEPSCIIRKRIGHLKPDGQDEWYTLTLETAAISLFESLESDFKQYVHPYIASIRSRDDIYNLLCAGYQSRLPLAQIHIMSCAGYTEAAAKMLTTEFMHSKLNPWYQSRLKELASDLKIAPERWMHKVK